MEAKFLPLWDCLNTFLKIQENKNECLCLMFSVYFLCMVNPKNTISFSTQRCNYVMQRMFIVLEYLPCKLFSFIVVLM